MEVYCYYFYLIAMGEGTMCTGMAGAAMEQQVAMILICNVSENDQFDLACYVLEKGPRPENVRIKLFKFILSMPGTLYSINK